MSNDILQHYGIKRRSGRYPWGTGAKWAKIRARVSKTIGVKRMPGKPKHERPDRTKKYDNRKPFEKRTNEYSKLNRIKSENEFMDYANNRWLSKESRNKAKEIFKNREQYSDNKLKEESKKLSIESQVSQELGKRTKARGDYARILSRVISEKVVDKLDTEGDNKKNLKSLINVAINSTDKNKSISDVKKDAFESTARIGIKKLADKPGGLEKIVKDAIAKQKSNPIIDKIINKQDMKDNVKSAAEDLKKAKKDRIKNVLNKNKRKETKEAITKAKENLAEAEKILNDNKISTKIKKRIKDKKKKRERVDNDKSR